MGECLGIDLQQVEKFPQKNIATFVGDMMSTDFHEEMRAFLRDIREEGKEIEKNKEEAGIW